MKPTTSSAARKRLALVAFSSLWLAACGGGGGGGDVVATAPAPAGGSSPASSPSASGPAAPAPGASAPSAGGAPAPQVSAPAAAFAAFDPVVLADHPLRDGAATARLAGGGNVALWVAGGPATPASTIMARLTDSAGHPVGNAFAVKAEVDTVKEVAVAASPDGGFLVVWAGFDAAFDGSNASALIQHLMARRYAADGSLLNETRLIVDPQFDVRGISVEPLPAGGYVVGWTMQGERMAPGWGYVQRLDASGAPAGAQVALVDTHTGSAAQESVSLAPLADGTVTAAWVQRPDVGTNTVSISTRRFGASMQPLGAPTDIAGTTQPIETFETSITGIRVAAAPAGANVALAWTVESAGRTEIRSGILAPGAATPSAVTSVTSHQQPGSIGQGTYPVITLRAESLGSGTYSVIWQELDASNRGAAATVFMQRHDAAGGVVGAPVELYRRLVASVSEITESISSGQDIGVDAGPDGHVVVTGQFANFADTSSPHVVLVGR